MFIGRNTYAHSELPGWVDALPTALPWAIVTLSFGLHSVGMQMQSVSTKSKDTVPVLFWVEIQYGIPFGPVTVEHASKKSLTAGYHQRLKDWW
jgi:hypothetical protein